METVSFCYLLQITCSQINWLWYAVAVVVVFGVGALWHSLLFAKAWMRVFKVEMPEKAAPVNMVITMLMQLVATALLGFALFMLTIIWEWMAVIVLLAFCGWQKGALKFRYVNWKEYFTAALVEVGYLFVAGAIFILFALL